MKKLIFLMVVFALALTIFSCEKQETDVTYGKKTSADADVQARAVYGDSGAPGCAADICRSFVRD